MMRFGSLAGLVIFGLVLTGCSTPAPKQQAAPAAVAPAEDAGANHAAVTPGSQTHVLNFHVEFANFSPEMKAVAQKARSRLEGKCWIHKAVEAPETPGSTDPHYCVTFNAFTGSEQLKPYKKVATDRKMLFSGIAGQEMFRAEQFVWDGKKIRRTARTDLRMTPEIQTEIGFANVLISWALK